MKEFLKSFRQRAGESENQLFFKEGELHSHLVLMINGKRIFLFLLSGADVGHPTREHIYESKSPVRKKVMKPSFTY